SSWPNSSNLMSASPAPQLQPLLKAAAQDKRIHLFLSLFISPDGQNSQKDFPKGLDAIQEELQEVGHRFRSVTYHNRQVFGPFYSAILKKVLFPEAEPDSGRDSM
uniref:Uncharacterized protein n=1 Tax=Meleagris gallopavo TaxID=9103 RepID=A0A803YBR6_MELGA